MSNYNTLYHNQIHTKSWSDYIVYKICRLHNYRIWKSGSIASSKSTNCVTAQNVHGKRGRILFSFNIILVYAKKKKVLSN